jgi:hypothetical protein
MVNPKTASSTAATKYYLLLFQQGTDFINRQTLRNIQIQLDDMISTAPADTEIDVWVESPGGDAHAAYKLVLDLRQRCRHLQAVVPDYAKSAATLLILGVDKIFMTPAAELGPLDIQIEHPDREGLILSALDVADSLEYLGKTAIDMVISGGGGIVYYTKLRRTEVLQMTLHFMAQFLQPTIAKLDPHLLHQAANQLRIAERYAINMLTKRKLPPISADEAKALMDQLIRTYPSHEYVISRDEARDLGLPVENIESYPRWQNVKTVYDNFIQGEESLICVLDESAFTPPQRSTPVAARQETDNEKDLHHIKQEASKEAGTEPNGSNRAKTQAGSGT